MKTDIGTPPVLDGTVNGSGVIIETTVDGAEAKIDTKPEPEQIRLIDVPLESLVHDFNKLWLDIESTEVEKKDSAAVFNARLKELKQRLRPIIAQMRLRDIHPAPRQQSFPIDDFDPRNQGDEDEPGDDEG